jgi:hypothetical protein
MNTGTNKGIRGKKLNEFNFIFDFIFNYIYSKRHEMNLKIARTWVNIKQSLGRTEYGW